MDWLVRINNALDRIEQSMEKRLDIEEIARTAYVSPFHFQRMFSLVTGRLTEGEYARKRRLMLAAQELAMTPAKVVDVALRYGYDSPESFAKAFRKIHGISPSEARLLGVALKAFPRLSFHLSLKGDKDMDYRIVEREPFIVAGRSFAVTCRDGANLREIPKRWAECHQDGTVAKLETIHEAILGTRNSYSKTDHDATFMRMKEDHMRTVNSSRATMCRSDRKSIYSRLQLAPAADRYTLSHPSSRKSKIAVREATMYRYR